MEDIKVIISDALNEAKSILAYSYEFWCTLIYYDTLHIDGQNRKCPSLYDQSKASAIFLSLLSMWIYEFIELSCPEIETSDSSILKETAAARLDAESLSNGSPTSGDNGKVWELGGLWNWIINKKSRGSKLNFPNEWVEYVVNGEGDNGGIGLDNMDSVENEGDKGGIGLDNLDSVENDGDKGGIGLDKMDSVENEGDVDNSMGVRPISDYIELSRVAKEISVVKEWEDGLGFQLLQEFPSK
ncbi:hypothetical protein IGI04_036139 [Brassica rapa subsp. trilocularis]|uniref:Uncharacterized protein n=1 Tax=Brassica rapa subsp. trilocularis TaxID=1813537 RepID=A0ABQ7LDP4_BRACM|nr:hypothetical protein IGI04_036139 [Brassica rapa subsp. trilocularis]